MVYPSNVSSQKSVYVLISCNSTRSLRKMHTLFPGLRALSNSCANKCVFSKTDLKSAYWQFPINEVQLTKTVFCSGPVYGSWEFAVMPYSLTDATQTCQHGLD